MEKHQRAMSGACCKEFSVLVPEITRSVVRRGATFGLYRVSVQWLLIKTIRHRGLKRLYEADDPSKLRADQVGRIAAVLADLDDAITTKDLDLPGYRLHPLKGDRKGSWSISLSGNWRIVFRFEDGDAYDVDLVDYH